MFDYYHLKMMNYIGSEKKNRLGVRHMFSHIFFASEHKKCGGKGIKIGVQTMKYWEK